jgi:hypothetical protein
MKHLLLSLAMLVLAASAYAAPVVDIYQPSYKNAHQLQNSLEKLYGDDVTFSIEGNQLLIRGERTMVNEIQELLLQLDHAPQVFWVSINSSPTTSGSKTYGTQRNKSLNTFRISEGETLFLVKQSNQQQLRSLGWARTSFEDVATQKEALSINVTSTLQTISIEVALQNRINNQITTTRNQVNGHFDQWLAIAANPQEPNSKHYGTRRSSGDLYIKVSKE